MNRFTPGQCLGQIFFWTLFAGCIGYFVGSPRYQHLPPNMATVKLSLVHAGQLLGECRSLSAEELARLPANMRAPQVCPRERSPLILELLVNGEALVSESIAPKGLHGDGRAAFYRRLTVLSGPVEVKVRMKDNVKASDFNYTAEYKTELAPAEVLVIDFNTEQKRFTFL